MAHRVDPKFVRKLVRFGAFDINACYNCGNCTAICPHSTDSESFPRRLIRFGQLGMADLLSGSRELWLCYYCGECSDTCPRAAEPGEFMAAARRYAIAACDKTGLSRLLYTSPLASIAVFAALGLVLVWGLLRAAGPWDAPFFGSAEHAKPGFIDAATIHDLGVIALGITALFMVLGIVAMIRNTLRAARAAGIPESAESVGARIRRGCLVTLRELGTQKHYRDCSGDYEAPEPWYRARWFAHWLMLWGFVGLLVATTWDFLLKSPDRWGEPISLLYPARLIGTAAGLAFLYGTSLALWQRLRPTTKYAHHSTPSDWTLIVGFWLLAVTGFALELLSYANNSSPAGNLLLLLHAVIAFELILLLPFTKLAHALYRPIAFFVHGYLGTAQHPVRLGSPRPPA